MTGQLDGGQSRIVQTEPNQPKHLVRDLMSQPIRLENLEPPDLGKESTWNFCFLSNDMEKGASNCLANTFILFTMQMKSKGGLPSHLT